MIINMGKIFKETARRFADKTALVNVERNRRFTFQELYKITNKICNMMQDKFGLRQGDVYATLLENDNASLINVWCLKGAPSGLWLNIRDSKEEHLYQLDYINPKIIFIENKLLPQYYEALKQREIKVICMDKPDFTDKNIYYFWELIESTSDVEQNIEYVANDVNQHVAVYRFTGGTTGRGKCAMYTAFNILFPAFCYCTHPEDLFPPETKSLCITPITHASGHLVLPVYFKGGTTLTLNRVDLEHLCQTIEKERVTLIYVVPTILYRMMDLGLEKKYDLSSLQTIRYGASPISPAKLEGLIEKFGSIFVQGYGATEAYPPATLLGKNEHSIMTERDRRRLSSLGRAIPGVEIKIADEDGNELLPGQKGEIWIRGPLVIEGYYKDPEQTRENFSDKGFWKSGDIGYMDEENYLYIVDRKKDMIISGGFNVYAIEVENVLNSHPAVRESAVVGIPHEEWGEAVHAEVILKEGVSRITEDELISYCKAKVAGYKVPKSIKFVEELPLSSVGKVLRRKVKEKYWQGRDRRVN